MGIPTYFQKILKHHTGALVVAREKREINEFYMDYNGVIYKIKANLDKELKEKSNEKLLTTSAYEKKLIKNTTLNYPFVKNVLPSINLNK